MEISVLSPGASWPSKDYSYNQWGACGEWMDQ